MPEVGYRGPVIDAHHHLWQLADGRYPWLRPGVLVPHRYGDYSPSSTTTGLRHAPRRRGTGPVATVSMEAEWDPADPVGETRYLDRIAVTTGVPGAMAAQARLDAEDVAEVSPRRRPTRPSGASVTSLEVRLGSRSSAPVGPGWAIPVARGLRPAADHGLHFELQTPWWNLHEAAVLAKDHPETLIVVNHGGVLLDHRRETFDGWRAAASALVADRPNVVVKASGLCTEADGRDPVVNREVLMTLVDVFGADRVMFGSNFPVDGLFTTYAAMLDGLRSILGVLSEQEQRAVFHDTADRVYRP